MYAYAGPTPGNDDFASYIEERFGDRLHRIFNPLDVVTHAWNVGDLARLALPEVERARLPLASTSTASMFSSRSAK